MASEKRERSVTQLTNPQALRAYAHPVRMALIGLLRTQGPLTATKAAGLLGESSGTCSFHLRQLAKYGLVEETGEGTGRNKPWRATTTSTRWSATGDTPQMRAAIGLLTATVAERYFEQAMQWLDRSEQEPQQWREASQFGDRFLYVTADELASLGRRVAALLDEYADRELDPGRRPADARLVTFLQIAFPHASKERSDGE